MELRRSRLNRTLQIATVVLLTVLFNPSFGSSRIVYWGSIGLFLLLTIASFGKKMTFDGYSKWIVVFVAYCGISIAWSLNKSYAFEYFTSMVVNLVILFIINSLLNSKEDLLSFLNIVCIALVLSAVYLLLTINWSLVGTNRLGTDFTGENWNANTIGKNMLWGIILLTFIHKIKRIKLPYLILGYIVFGFLMFSAGSRNSFLGFMIFFLSYIIFKGNVKSIVFRIAVIALLLVLAIYGMLNVPYLYTRIGYRFEALFSYYRGDILSDHSLYLRQLYTKVSMEAFRERPIFGYGINNARVFIGRASGHYTYSHNTYAEMLVDFGIVGTIIFFYEYLTISISTVKDRIQQNSWMSSFGIACLITLILTQSAYIAYTDILTLMIILVISKMNQVNLQFLNEVSHNEEG